MRAVVSLAIAGLFSAAGCGDDVTSTAQGPEDFTRSLAGRCLAEDGKAWCFRPPWFTDDTPGHRAALGRADLFMNPVPPVDLGEDFQVLGLAGLGQGGDICALDTEGRLKCWADSMFDLDGLGDAEAFGDEAVEMGDALPFFDLGTEQRALGVAVSSPGWFCAWFEDGKAKCFGQEVFGVPSHDHSDVLGDAAAERGDAIPFVDLGTNVRIKSLHGAASRAQMCAITEEGGVKCWGKDIALFTSNVYPRRYFPDWGDAEEEMGDGLPYIDLGTGFVASHVAIGSRHTCALSESGEVRCWGVNQTFDGETEEPLFSGMCGRGDMESPIFWGSPDHLVGPMGSDVERVSLDAAAA